MSSPDFDLTTSVPGEGRSRVRGRNRELPRQIGRYRVERLLGKGGFGLVYLARDEQLARLVAVKVPHADLVNRRFDDAEYLKEARTVANLDHPTIVPVYDIGSTDEYPYYVVSKFIEGADLAKQIKQSRQTWAVAASIVAQVAEAIHYAHTHGLVHRDIKPSNILIAQDGKPYVVDFGLALREEDIGKGPKYAGTPAYMSPEQVRGEGHRVDGRTDIFSLGVVLYELLVGRKPFTGNTRSELLEQVTRYEPRPLRQYDDKIPQELERICQKAMSKRAADRYTTATDMADDLRYILDQQTVAVNTIASSGVTDARSETIATNSATVSPQSTTTATTNSETSSTGSLATSDHEPLRVVPKGLRSFDKHDSDFFLELLPGPRDRNGLPDSLRFWKQRIEETNGNNTFTVGLICGPSGCGKSSLVKAGLLTRLNPRIMTVYVEATADIESGLLREVRRNVPGVRQDLGLRDTLAALRQGTGAAYADKVLLVIDQFEQWLHANNDREDTELVQALRQCDGGRLQCIVMVRDDFWMSVIRFMRELEVRLVEGENSQAVDLFPTRHARKVLAAYGRAYGELPENPHDMTNEQKEFLKQAVESLAENGRVICIRLALFAEMTKGKPWTPATLKQLGGTTGVGVTFLEETFSASTAPPQHRYHQKAARSILNALLPDADSNIKGMLRGEHELLAASGYAARPRDFEDLLQRLDGELRLITPADPGSIDEELDSTARAVDGERYYQLSHDYLVPAIREWVTRKRKETRRGRAELRLAERCASWIRKPEARYLPSSWEYLNVKFFTDGKTWSPQERAMMRSAGRRHGLRWLVGTSGVLVVAMIIYSFASASQHRNLLAQTTMAVAALQNSSGSAVPYAIRDLDALPRPLVLDELQARFSEAGPDRGLSLAYALAHYGDVRAEYLLGPILQLAPGEVTNLVVALKSDREKSLASIRQAINSSDRQRKARLAIIAAHLGDDSIAKEMCQIEGRPDPQDRTMFIAELTKFHGDLTAFSESLANADSALRSAICLGVGGVTASERTPSEEATWLPILRESFSQAPDASTHNAAAWALTTWGEEVPPLRTGNTDQEWHVNSLGMTMVKLPAGTFSRPMAPNPTIAEPDNGTLQTVTLTKPFYLGAREVSLDLFQQFIDDAQYAGTEKPLEWLGVFEEISPTPAHPVQSVNWEDAVLFCNWLSHRENLSPRYQRINDAAANQWETVDQANGYRLPTAAEWEYACRAGSQTDFSSGDDESLLDGYAVFGAKRTEPCGSKLCNAWGLFDMHGNLWEWCEDRYGDYPPTAYLDDPRGPTEGDLRVDRGGSWNSSAGSCRSVYHNAFDPAERNAYLGFRVARTINDE